MVNLANVRMGCGSSKLVVFSEELEEPILERLMARLDGIQPASHAHYLIDHVGDALRRQAAKDDPFAVIVAVAERSKRGTL
jgi:hypothetical protein